MDALSRHCRIGPHVCQGLALATLLGAAASGWAQPRLEVLTTFGPTVQMVEVDAAAGSFGRVLNVTPLAELDGRILAKPVVLSGARYVVWVAPEFAPGAVRYDFVVFDRRTRRATRAGLQLAGAPAWLLTDPYRPRVFFATFSSSSISPATTLWVLDARQPVPRAIVDVPGGSVVSLSYAPSADQLAVGLVDTTGNALALIDVATGREVRRAVVDDSPYNVHVDSGATRAWIQAIDGLQLWDLVSARRLASNSNLRFTFGNAGRFVLQETEDRLVGFDAAAEFLMFVRASTLEERGRLRIEDPPGVRDVLTEKFVRAGHGPAAVYLLRRELLRDPVVCTAIQIGALTNTLDVVGVTDVLPRLGSGRRFCLAELVAVRPPEAPAGLSVAVSANSVSLEWADPGNATEFEVEYGFAPGQRAGSIRVGQTSRVTIPGVPAGEYFVRVTARNDVGAGPASNEVRLLVP